MVRFIPHLFTFANAFFGFLAVVKTLDDQESQVELFKGMLDALTDDPAVMTRHAKYITDFYLDNFSSLRTIPAGVIIVNYARHLSLNDRIAFKSRLCK